MSVRRPRAALTVSVAAAVVLLPACGKRDDPTEASRRNLEEIREAIFAHTGNLTKPDDIRNLGSFPAGIVGPDRKSLGLSWRVLLLPKLGQDELYRAFRLDEAWDGPHNRELVARMPAVYAAPGAGGSDGRTHYRGPTGPQGVFRPYLGSDGTRYKPGAAVFGASVLRVTDGTANTIMVVEAEEPVVWTQPDELPVGGDHPAPKLRTVGGGAHVLFCDGTVRRLPADIPEVNLKALCTYAGGEPSGEQSIP